MQLSTTEAVKLMRKLEVEFVESSHHVRGFLVVDGKKLFPVHCSFGKKDLPGRVPQLFRKSLKLTTEEFEVLRSCKIDRDRYITLLREKGEIEG